MGFFLVREQSKEYCENTSLHGFQYLVKTGMCAYDKKITRMTTSISSETFEKKNKK